MCLLVVLPGCLIPAEFHEGREFYDNAGACVKIILTLFFCVFSDSAICALNLMILEFFDLWRSDVEETGRT